MKICIEFTPDELLRASQAGMLEALFEVTKSETEKARKKETPKAEPEAESKEISLEEVRAAFIAKNSKANTAKLKAVLNKFNVKKVTDLDPADYSEVLNQLEAI
jgi:hypothetical protein